MHALKDYDVHIDSKKRVTLRGAMYSYYNVKEYDNGCIVLEPRELTVPNTISEDVLSEMNQLDEIIKDNTELEQAASE